MLDRQLNNWGNAPAGIESSLPPPPKRAPPGAPVSTVVHVTDPVGTGDSGVDALFDTVNEPQATTVHDNRADFADSALPSAAASPASPLQIPTSPVASPVVQETTVVQGTTSMDTGDEVESEARSKRSRTDASEDL